MASKGGKSKPDIVMASKSGKSKPDNESRAKRQKTLEAPKEPRRPKTHWDHVLEEMAWLSKVIEGWLFGSFCKNCYACMTFLC
jgi:E1A-binding protein p400